MEDKDFFISYQSHDQSWAEWVAWTLVENGYSVHVQAWDFRPGGNFVNEMQERIAKSKRIIALLSNEYLNSAYTTAEWMTAFVNDPKGENRTLLPIRIKKCEPKGLLKAIVYIDLVELDEKTAISKLLSGIEINTLIPNKKPIFPGDSSYSPFFPNSPHPIDKILEKYETLLQQEFGTLVDRKNNPTIESRTSFLFYGEGFPLGTNKVIPEISKYSLFLDIDKLVSATIGKYKSGIYVGVRELKPHLLYKIATCRWRIYVSAIADGLVKYDSSLLFSSLIGGLKENSIKKPQLELLELAQKYIHFVPSQNSKDGYETTKRFLYLLGCLATDNDIDLEDLLNEEQRKYRTQSIKSDMQFDNEGNIYILTISFSDVEGTYDAILNALSFHNINIIASKSWIYVPDEVAGAELVVKYKGKIDFSSELEAIIKSDQLHSIFIRYAIEESSKKNHLASFVGI